MFGGPWAFLVGGEQGIVVIGLDEQPVQVAEAIDHAASDMADIGDKAEALGVMADDKADGVDGVVVDGEAADDDVVDVEGL